MSNASGVAHTILIITEGQMGDLLLLTPAIRGIRKAEPEARIILFVVERRGNDEHAPDIIYKNKDHLLSSNPHVSEVYTIRRDRIRRLSGTKRISAEFQAVRFVRSLRPDVVLCTFPEERFAIWALVSGAHVRIGQPTKGLRRSFTRVPQRRKGDGSILEYFHELSALAGNRDSSDETEYFVTKEGERWADEFLSSNSLTKGQFVVVHPGATGDYKIWPPDRFGLLIGTLLQRTENRIVICGGPLDRGVVDSVARHSENASVLIHIEKDVGRFASLLKRAALLISNDSGPRHLAVALGTPSLAMFRHFHDREWGIYPDSPMVRTMKPHDPCPTCPPGRCNDVIPSGFTHGSTCLRQISTEEVAEQAIEMLARQSVSGAR